MKSKIPAAGKLAIAGAGILALGAFFSKAKAATGPDPVLVTDHDAAWDYLYKSGRWFTRRKGGATWIDMQDSLSAQNYDLALSRLSKYIL